MSKNTKLKVVTYYWQKKSLYIRKKFSLLNCGKLTH